MKTLFKNGFVIDVFSDSYSKKEVLVEDERIIGVGEYTDSDADAVVDLKGKFICPGLIDGHIHIESTLLSPYEFAKVAVAHGTTTVVCDPHEIANVAGTAGIDYMLKATEGLPLDFYIMIPSCVPSTAFDESFESLDAEKIKPYFKNEKVLGLAEMMNYVGVINNDEDIKKKIKYAKDAGKHVDGHSPFLSGKDLDKYVSGGISTEHECSLLREAKEKLSKGMWIMIREGTAAKNLEELSPLMDGATGAHCIFCTDDREAESLVRNGEIDNILNFVSSYGKSVMTGIRMATINAALCFNLKNVGAIAPGYNADMLILDSLMPFKLDKVYKKGILVSEGGKALPFEKPELPSSLMKEIRGSMNVRKLNLSDFHVKPPYDFAETRIITVIPGQILTYESKEVLNFHQSNGVDTAHDIVKIAVIERHKATGHIGLGFIKGFGIKEGAIASTVSHDSHNIIVVGTNDTDMLIAAETLIEMGGGRAVVKKGAVLCKMPLEIGGIMTDAPVAEVIRKTKEINKALKKTGIANNISPFMNMSFISLPVIPSIKLTTFGLFDVANFRLVDLFPKSEESE